MKKIILLILLSPMFCKAQLVSLVVRNDTLFGFNPSTGTYTQYTKLVPSPIGQSGKFVSTNGTAYSWGYPNILDSARKKPLYSWDYMAAGVATANFSTTAIGAGTAAYTNTAAGHPGYMTTTSSATANSGHYSYYLNLNSLMYFQGGEVYEAIYQPKLASNTNTTTRIGFHDATTVTDAVDGAYFEIPPGSFDVVGKTANNSTRTTSSALGTLTVNSWYKFRITVNSNATSILFEIYDDTGVLVGSQTNTTNIPTTSARLFGAGYISTNSGTVSTLLGWLDYQAVQLNFPNR